MRGKKTAGINILGNTSIITRRHKDTKKRLEKINMDIQDELDI